MDLLFALFHSVMSFVFQRFLWDFLGGFLVCLKINLLVGSLGMELQWKHLVNGFNHIPKFGHGGGTRSSLVLVPVW